MVQQRGFLHKITAIDDNIILYLILLYRYYSIKYCDEEGNQSDQDESEKETRCALLLIGANNTWFAQVEIFLFREYSKFRILF